MSETAKIRDKVFKYCKGKGIDLGCGDDKITPSAIGIDLRSQVSPDIVWDISVGLPYKNEEFDYVYSSHFLEHLDGDIEDILREWVRILKIGGFLILYLPHKDYYKEYNPEHKRVFDDNDIIAVLDKIGGIGILENYLDVGTNRYSFLLVVKRKG